MRSCFSSARSRNRTLLGDCPSWVGRKDSFQDGQAFSTGIDRSFRNRTGTKICPIANSHKSEYSQPFELRLIDWSQSAGGLRWRLENHRSTMKGFEIHWATKNWMGREMRSIIRSCTSSTFVSNLEAQTSRKWLLGLRISKRAFASVLLPVRQ